MDACAGQNLVEVVSAVLGAGVGALIGVLTQSWILRRRSRNSGQPPKLRL